METITYLKLTKENFNDNSLDEFIRYQEVNVCWRKINNELVLVENNYIENWNLDERKGIAKKIEKGISDVGYGYGAYLKNKVIGYVYLPKQFFGSDNQYIELKQFHVSEPFRRKGIGRELFKLACKEAKKLGAEKLYISAHSSIESQSTYHKLGCVEAKEVNREIAEKEPFDIQMEYQL